MKKNKPEVYLSFDVEADGPCPGVNSMLSLGCAAITPKGDILDTFSVNFEQIPEARENRETMKWWSTQPDAWTACRAGKIPPKDAMIRFQVFVRNLLKDYKVVPVAYPAGFDWTFLYYYMVRYLGSSMLGFGCLDMKSYAMAKLGKPFKQTTKRNMPKSWFDKKLKHTHISVDDAIEQAHLFVSMLNHESNS